jgi:hypothetical protein
VIRATGAGGMTGVLATNEKGERSLARSVARGNEA